MKNLRRRLS